MTAVLANRVVAHVRLSRRSVDSTARPKAYTDGGTDLTGVRGAGR